MRAILATVVATGVIVLAPPVLATDVYPPQVVKVAEARVDRRVVELGEPVRLRGDGYRPGIQVRVEARDDVILVRADEVGRLDVELQLRRTGTALLAASGQASGGGVRVLSATVRVVPDGERSLADGAYRRSDVLPGLLRGLAVVVAMALLTLGVRLYRRPSALG